MEPPRHFEFNMFYFYAGKLGQFFSDAAVQIRLFQPDSLWNHGSPCHPEYPEKLCAAVRIPAYTPGLVYFQLFHLGRSRLFYGLSLPVRAGGKGQYAEPSSKGKLPEAPSSLLRPAFCSFPSYILGEDDVLYHTDVPLFHSSYPYAFSGEEGEGRAVP